MRDYKKFFEGYDVPEQLKETAICIMRRFTIFGICDGMYICNVIAFESGFGDGKGNFPGKIQIDISKSADHLMRAYGYNIHNHDTEDLEEILRTGKLDIPKATIGLKDDIDFYKKEIRSCGEAWRKDYLQRCIHAAELTLNELAEEAKISNSAEEINVETQCYKLTESERKTLQFYLKKALIDAEGLLAIGFGDKQTVNNIKSILKKTGK